MMERRTLYLEDGGLIVGEKGDKPWSAPTFPELCCHTMADFENMNDRERVYFRVSEEDKRIQKEVIIPYWKDRAMMTKMNRHLPDEWQKMFKAGMFTEFLQQRGPGHTVADGKIYKKGYLDFMADIDREIEQLDFNNDLDAMNKKDELAGMHLVCEAMVIFGERYAALARERAQQTDDPVKKQELIDLAEVCDVVPAHKPETFRQALQMYWFTHIGVTYEMINWDAY